MKAGDDVFWFGFACVFRSRNFSEFVGKHIHHNFGASSDQTTYSRAMPDCSFIFSFSFFLGAGGGRGVCGECLSLKSLVERMQTIEREQSVIVLFHACLHHVFGMHEVCTLSVWREIPFIVDMEHVF